MSSIAFGVLGCSRTEDSLQSSQHIDAGKEDASRDAPTLASRGNGGLEQAAAATKPNAFPEAGNPSASLERPAGVKDGEPARNLWEEFVRDPNPETFERCKELIQEAVDGHASYKYGYGKPSPAAQQIEGSYEDDAGQRVYVFSEVRRLVVEANPYAMELVMFYAPLSDGGNAEDLCIALGQSITKKPELFLKLLATYMNDDGKRIPYIVGMLPVEVTDQTTTDAADAMIAGRVKAFESVDDPALTEMRDLCLKALTGEK